MKHTLLRLVMVAVVSALAIAQAQTSAPQQQAPAERSSPAAAGSQTGVALQPGTLIYAELSKSIDSKKAKAGDPVIAKSTQAVLSHGSIAIPRGAKLVGHLTTAKAHTKDQPQAELGIVFDRAELKDGTQVPLTSASIQAIGRLSSAPGLDASSTADSSMGSSPSMGGGGISGGSRVGGSMGGMNSPIGVSPYPNPSGAGTDPGAATPAPSTAGGERLNASSRGVIGMSGVTLQSGPNGSVVAADQKNVKLDGGTELVLRVSQ